MKSLTRYIKESIANNAEFERVYNELRGLGYSRGDYVLSTDLEDEIQFDIALYNDLVDWLREKYWMNVCEPFELEGSGPGDYSFVIGAYDDDDDEIEQRKTTKARWKQDSRCREFERVYKDLRSMGYRHGDLVDSEDIIDLGMNANDFDDFVSWLEFKRDMKVYPPENLTGSGPGDYSYVKGDTIWNPKTHQIKVRH